MTAQIIDLATWRLSHPARVGLYAVTLNAWMWGVRMWLAMWGVR